jgi:hypothetical protein
MEHCMIAPKQRLVKVLSDIQMSEAIKHASVQPREHQRATEKYIKDAKSITRKETGTQRLRQIYQRLLFRARQIHQ